jgi:rSAM/selenodomain-associated transferase 2
VLSVIVPTLDEAARVEGLLGALHPQLRGSDELLVVDGGSHDGTPERARTLGLPGVSVVEAAQGRATQMNHGARLARGEWLFFLHADSFPPPGLLEGVRVAARSAPAGWGHFRVRLMARGWLYRGIEVGMDLRSRLLRTPSGDQGLFVRRDRFEGLGGFPEVPLGEDLLLVDGLRSLGPPVVAAPWLGTSARRWERGGVLRTVGSMWALRIALRAGIPPRLLAGCYPAVR